MFCFRARLLVVPFPSTPQAAGLLNTTPDRFGPRPAVRYKMLSCLFEYNAEQTAPAAPAISPGQHRARGLGAGGASRSADNLKEPRPPFLCRKDSGYCIQPQTLSNSFH